MVDLDYIQEPNDYYFISLAGHRSIDLSAFLNESVIIKVRASSKLMCGTADIMPLIVQASEQ